MFENGRDALNYYKKSWRSIDLVILDMIMPEMDGNETFLAMKEINQHIKAIICSGYNLNEEVQNILDKGVTGFIQKPFKINQFSVLMVIGY